MNMRTRKAIGCFGLLTYLGVYAVLAATLGSALTSLIPTWMQLVYYAIAGIIWIFPLKPLFGWMNRPD
jgi:membrane protein implicated in regulation of membrane protease activity